MKNVRWRDFTALVASIGVANHEAIGAAKAGVEGLALAAAASYARSGVRVNCVAPGWIGGPNVETYIGWEAQARGCPPEEIRAEIEGRIPLRMIPPQDDIAQAVVFLASPLARYITGTVIPVDGGLRRYAF